MKRLALNIQELRYGNLINSQPEGTISVISRIYGRYGVCCISIDNNHEIHENKNQWFGPIPISEEWLLKLGFENSRIIVNLADELCYDKYNKEIVYQTKGSGFIRRYGIKYIHQLQNIFYILTGEKLKLK